MQATDPVSMAVAKTAHARTMTQLMPGGKPDYLGVIKFPMIKDLIQEAGEPNVILLVSSLIHDFCTTMNKARNMNAAQIAEAAFMLVNESGTFRIEDYAMMFAMAKRGELVKIYESIDLTTIAAIRDEYDRVSIQKMKEAEQAEYEAIEGGGIADNRAQVWDGKKGAYVQQRTLGDAADGIGAAFDSLRNGLKDNGYARTRAVDPGAVPPIPRKGAGE